MNIGLTINQVCELVGRSQNTLRLWEKAGEIPTPTRRNGWRTYLLVFAKGTNDVYGAYLDELENKGDYYDTPNRIRIYLITSFRKWDSNQFTGSTEVKNEISKSGKGNSW